MDILNPFEAIDRASDAVGRGNKIEIGFHEQTRLQPEIAESLHASIIDPAHFMQSLIRAISPARSWISRVLLNVTQLFGRLKPVDAAINTLITTA